MNLPWLEALYNFESLDEMRKPEAWATVAEKRRVKRRCAPNGLAKI
jgi:hypothetical protein